MSRSGKAIYRLTLSAMIAALTAVTTAYIFHIPMAIFGGQGYVHIGDAIIYLGASLLPTGYICAAAAIGGALADILCGSALWAPWTFVIKALIAFCFTASGKKILHKRNYLALVFACLITVIGYYIAEGFLYGNWVAPLYSVTGNVIQSAASAVLYVFLGLVLDRINIKKQIRLEA